jgi:CheY-like chemotaxis protein
MIENDTIPAEQHPILLVEDSVDDVNLIDLAFKRLELPYRLEVVSGGFEAVSYLEGDGKYADRARFPMPRLLLLDLDMPGMDGFEVLGWVRRHLRLRRMPVVVLTHSTYAGDINRAYQMGANSFLVKPADFTEFVETLRQALDYWLAHSRLPGIPAAETANAAVGNGSMGSAGWEGLANNPLIMTNSDEPEEVRGTNLDAEGGEGNFPRS